MSHPKARMYVAGENRSLDELAESYSRIENVPAFSERPEEREERSVEDPLGFKGKKQKNADPYFEGKIAAERMTKFFGLCVGELELDPAQAIYAMELTALNILNAKDCPIPAARMDAIRAEAFRYYQEAIKKIPG